MSDLRPLIIVAALFAVLLSAMRTERFGTCPADDRACRDRMPWYAAPVARLLGQAQEAPPMP